MLARMQAHQPKKNGSISSARSTAWITITRSLGREPGKGAMSRRSKKAKVHSHQAMQLADPAELSKKVSKLLEASTDGAADEEVAEYAV